jgi:twinkle protein
MHYAFQRYGANHFIDSLCIDGLEEEYAKQSKFINILTQFAMNTDAHVHLVAHPKRSVRVGTMGKRM